MNAAWFEKLFVKIDGMDDSGTVLTNEVGHLRQPNQFWGGERLGLGNTDLWRNCFVDVHQSLRRLTWLLETQKIK